jgi:uncharacterized cupredoxin-like copper-binding protein
MTISSKLTLATLLITALSTAAFADIGHTDSGKTEAALGSPAAAEAATKLYGVSLEDSMRIEFTETPEIHQGDIITFVITNNGNIPHEFSLGSLAEQEAHREMMVAMPNMKHEDGNSRTVAPGETSSLTWKFTGNEEILFSCNIPGHYQSGMIYETAILK